MNAREKRLWYAVVLVLAVAVAQAAGIVMRCLGDEVKDCVLTGGAAFAVVLTLGIASLVFFAEGDGTGN